MLHWAQEHHYAWCCTSRADRQVSPVSQENWNAQTLRVRAANRAFSTSKPPRSCYSMYGCSTKEVWEGIWLRSVLSFCSEGQLCSVGEEFWGVLSAAWLMRCVWGCGGSHTRVWWQTIMEGKTSCRTAGKQQEECHPQPLPQLIYRVQFWLWRCKELILQGSDGSLGKNSTKITHGNWSTVRGFNPASFLAQLIRALSRGYSCAQDHSLVGWALSGFHQVFVWSSGAQ